MYNYPLNSSRARDQSHSWRSVKMIRYRFQVAFQSCFFRYCVCLCSFSKLWINIFIRKGSCRTKQAIHVAKPPRGKILVHYNSIFGQQVVQRAGHLLDDTIFFFFIIHNAYVPTLYWPSDFHLEMATRKITCGPICYPMLKSVAGIRLLNMAKSCTHDHPSGRSMANVLTSLMLMNVELSSTIASIIGCKWATLIYDSAQSWLVPLSWLGRSPKEELCRDWSCVQEGSCKAGDTIRRRSKK